MLREQVSFNLSTHKSHALVIKNGRHDASLLATELTSGRLRSVLHSRRRLCRVKLALGEVVYNLRDRLLGLFFISAK